MHDIGALTGFISSLVFAFWMSFGQPRPSTKRLLLSIDKCSRNISLLVKRESSIGNETTEMENVIPKIIEDQDVNMKNEDDENYFYLYRISYTWYAFIGFALTILIGAFSSRLYHQFYYSIRQGGRRTEPQLDPNLFITPIRNQMLNDQNVTNPQIHKISILERNDMEHVQFHELNLKETDKDDLKDETP